MFQEDNFYLGAEGSQSQGGRFYLFLTLPLYGLWISNGPSTCLDSLFYPVGYLLRSACIGWQLKNNVSYGGLNAFLHLREEDDDTEL